MEELHKRNVFHWGMLSERYLKNFPAFQSICKLKSKERPAKRMPLKYIFRCDRRISLALCLLIGSVLYSMSASMVV